MVVLPPVSILIVQYFPTIRPAISQFHSLDILICIIPFATAKKAMFKKGLFLTSVVNIGNSSETLEKEFLDTVIDYIRKRREE